MRYASRVKETSTTTGLGTLSLDGAVSGFRTFVGAGLAARKVAYMLIHGTAWERGIGTVSQGSPDTVSRDTVLESSTGAPLNLGSGTKTVMIASGPDTFVHGGHIHGLAIGNNATDILRDIDIAAGEAVSNDVGDADRVLMELFAPLTKQIDAPWVAGTNAGGLSSSLTLTANTTYHIFLMRVGGQDDVGFDTSVTAANLIADHGATHVRRIGSRRTNSSSNVVLTRQHGDAVYLDVPVLDSTVISTGTAARTISLSVPTGISVRPLSFLHVRQGTNVSQNHHLVTSLSQTDAAPTNLINSLSHQNTGADQLLTSRVPIFAVTNPSGQIRVRSDLSASNLLVEVYTYGWIDRRL